MTRLLVGLVLFSSVGFSVSSWAEQSVLELLSDEQNLSPQELMLKVEKEYSGVICDFEIDVENGELIYEVSVIDAERETVNEFEFKAKGGGLLNQKVERLEVADKYGLKALILIEKMGQTFYSLVNNAMHDRNGYIVGAKIDHDLGISYLEIKLVDDAGKRKLAFDIESQRPLPLLTWN